MLSEGRLLQTSGYSSNSCIYFHVFMYLFSGLDQMPHFSLKGGQPSDQVLASGMQETMICSKKKKKTTHTWCFKFAYWWEGAQWPWKLYIDEEDVRKKLCFGGRAACLLWAPVWGFVLATHELPLSSATKFRDLHVIAAHATWYQHRCADKEGME